MRRPAGRQLHSTQYRLAARVPARQLAWLLWGLCVVLFAGAQPAPTANSDNPDSSVPGSPAADSPSPESAPPKAAERSSAASVVVPLPIDGLVDTRAIQRIDRILATLPSDGPRPLLVVEFRGSEERTGQGSQFERSLALARYLASAKLRRVRTVAFAPRGLAGHAILPALACEELIIGPDAELGPAGLDEGSTDATVRRGYEEVVERRRTLPWPFVLGMLDRDVIVSKVELAEGVRYVLDDERERLEREQPVRAVTTVKPAGELGRYTGRDLRLKYGFASHLAADAGSLASALGLPRRLETGDPSADGGWRALRVEVRGPIHKRTIGWIRRSIEQQLQEQRANLLIVKLNTPGGSLNDSLALANYLAELDPEQVRTVAWVAGEARGDAALIALACDRLVMSAEGLLGGTGTADFGSVDAETARPSLESLAERKQIGWSLPLAMIDADVKLRVYQCDGTEQLRLMSEDEHSGLEDRERWLAGAEAPTLRGIRGRQAEEWQLVEFLAEDWATLREHYHLEQDGIEVSPTWAHLFIERLADPRIAALLLFVAWFALMFEFMTPSLTGAGFLSAVCFLLYFWSQFLHGTAGWLEVLLFLAGVTGVLLELFVFPGVGVLGFGGGALILVSIVLASQTFVLPRNQYQFQQLSLSLGVLIAGIAGGVLALACLRHLLPRSPVFSRLMLRKPDSQALHELKRRESVADYGYLAGQQGRTLTRLMPGGKARFGDAVVDVVSDGEVVGAGDLVEVVEAIGTHVLVRRVG